MIFEQGQRIVFIGDSITDCGRRDAFAPYGNGYVSLVRAFVTARYAELGLTWENRGIGGNTTRHLKDRWEEDVVALEPDWLSVKIGINDVWRKYGVNAHEAVPIDEYEANLRHVLRRAVDCTGCRLIIAEPYVIEKEANDPQLRDTTAFGLVARRLAEEFGAVNVRTQEAFDTALETTEASDWAADRIHPNLAGHAVIAQAFLTAVGFEWGASAASPYPLHASITTRHSERSEEPDAKRLPLNAGVDDAI
jgi:lysophospholipase L1-like esterase